MKAAILKEKNTPYEIEEVILDNVHANEVKVKIIATGMCHSDEALRIGEAPFDLPGILGHEGAGVVEEVGPGVTDLKKGDQVLLTHAHCGHCSACLSGNPTICEHWYELNAGGTAFDGRKIFEDQNGNKLSNFYNQSSFSEYTIVHRNNIVKVDSKADLRILGPLGCGFLTGSGTVFNGLKPKAGEGIAIFGTGAVGDAAIMAAKIVGCHPIIAIDIHDSRLEEAQMLGATHSINSKDQDPVELIDEITQEKGVKYSIDTTGITPVMETARDVLGKNSIFAPVAVTSQTFETSPFQDLVSSQKSIKGVLMGDAVPQLSITQLIEYNKQGLFDFDKLIKYYDFEEINQAAEDSNSGKTVKPVLILDKSYSI